MEALGAAAGIIGIVQFGFSLATQITTYIGDYQDASEDITNLAGEVTTTFRHVEQLQLLVDHNATSKAFSDSGLLEAESCKIKATQLAGRLWKLVKKSNATLPADGSLSADDLDISIFNKAKWPVFKPRVEQHKHELVVLNTNILICMVGYRMNPGAAPADQVRAVEELDRLKRSKKLALSTLRAAQARRKRKKGRSQDDRKPHFMLNDATQDPRDNGPIPLRPRESSRGASYDDYSRDDGGWVPDEALIDQIEEDLRRDILLQIEENEAAKRRSAEEIARARAEAVEKYKSDLLVKLNESAKGAEDLQKALVKWLPGTVSESAVAHFVDERKADAVKDDEVANLMRQLVSHQPPQTATTASTSEVTSSVRHSRDPKGAGRRLALLARGYVDWRRERRGRDRTHFEHIKIFSVIVSVDGDVHRAPPITVPTPWTDQLLTEQEKKGWWKGASFKETLRTYARLDLKSRNVAEDEADKVGIDSSRLVLIYARQLDSETTKGRKFLETTMMAPDPWEYFHGRALVIYKVSESDEPRHKGGSSYYDSTTDSHMSRDEAARRRSRAEQRSREIMLIESGRKPPGHGRSRRGSRSRSRSRTPPRSRSPSPTPPKGPHGYDADEDEYRLPRRYEPVRIEERYAPEGRRTMDLYLDDAPIYETGTYPRLGSYEEHRRPSRRRSGLLSPTLDRRPGGNLGYRHVPEGSAFRPEPRLPTYPKVHLDHLSPSTLEYYDLPYEFDRYNPDYIIVLREMDQHQVGVLLEHTRRLGRGNRPSTSSRRHGTHYLHADDDLDYTRGESYRPRSHGRAPAPIINIYNDYDNTAEDRVDSKRSRSHGHQPVDMAIAPPPFHGHPNTAIYREPPSLDDRIVLERPRHEAKRAHEGRSVRPRSPSRAQSWTQEPEDRLDVRERELLSLRKRHAQAEAAAMHDAERSRSSMYRERERSSARSQLAERLELERIIEVREPAHPLRSPSALSTSRNLRNRSQDVRSRLRSRSRALDRSRERRDAVEEKPEVEEPDSPSDLFESEMSDDGSGDEAERAKAAASNGKQRERGSGGRYSMLGLESTTESPSSLSDSEKPSTRTSYSDHIPGYHRPYAETITDPEPESSRRSTADSSWAASRSSARPGSAALSRAQSTTSVFTTPTETDDETVYQTAVESHEDDDDEGVPPAPAEYEGADPVDGGHGRQTWSDRGALHAEPGQRQAGAASIAAGGRPVVEEVD
ncbi:hypothetical protein LTR53_016288 [Teratosphaeriaceae sp. CCFEE 6253]|nr:hypothetical protein LTR53_016288 [Teratosphaeriaceae sp. CCFEE 6253]